MAVLQMPDDQLMIRLLRSHVEKEVQAMIQPAIDAIVGQAVHQAAEGMRVHLQQFVDQMNRDLLVKVTVDLGKEGVPHND